MCPIGVPVILSSVGEISRIIFVDDNGLVYFPS
jgi:hypothetical protein